MARTIRERMNVRDNEVFTPIDLINAKNIIIGYQLFFGTKPVVSIYGPNKSISRDYTQKEDYLHLGPVDFQEKELGLRCVDVHYTYTRKIVSN